MNFSVLLPVYYADDPVFLRRAIESVTVEQELRPTQVVLVVDGPIGQQLQEVIDEQALVLQAENIDCEIIYLAENRGLATALDCGLAKCKYDVVARADADDISVASRFAKQIPLMRNHDLVGSDIVEFESDEHCTSSIRTMPATCYQIRSVAQLRSPFNHPSVVYNKSVVEKAGGYIEVNKMEDYYLFVRMLMAGARACNINEALVKYRIGSGAYDRRGGLAMFASEVQLQKLFYQIGFTSMAQMVKNLTIRATYRLIPTKIRKIAYGIMLRRSWKI